MSEDNSTFFDELTDLAAKHVTPAVMLSGEVADIISALAETLGKTIAFCGMGDAGLTSDLLEGAAATMAEVAAENQHIGAFVALARNGKTGRPN